jgi:hypothetical protein
MRYRLALVAGAVAALLSPTGAGAATILFDFNPLAANLNTANGNDPVESYMEGLYGTAITVARGAKTLKGRPEEPHPKGLYLGNSDGALDRGPFVTPPGHPDPKDTYLINRWNSNCCLATEKDRITIIFEERPILAAEFDWEIFPVNSNGTTADFTFKADGVTYFYTALTTLAEKQLGDLGHFSVTFPRPVRKLEFIDWTDAPIGIDNLRVTVPGPAPAVLLGAGLALLGAMTRWWKRRG